MVVEGSADGNGGFRIGIDLGGTKIERLVLDPSGAEIHRRRIAAPQGRYAATIEAVGDLIAEADALLQEKASVGVGIPGAISPATGLVRGANSTWLNGKALDRDLSAHAGRPVRVANDANCFALSEATDGAGAGAGSVFGVILGTGVGGGFVVGGALVEGASGMAGEWGHTAFPWRDEEPGARRACWCGKTDCIETWLSGPGFLSELDEAERPTTVQQLVDRAAQGDPRCTRLLAKYPARLARALSTVVNILDPEVIVLGGGLSNIDGLAETVQEQLAAHIFNDRVATRVRRAQHGDSSGVRGAAWLWPAPLNALT